MKKLQKITFISIFMLVIMLVGALNILLINQPLTHITNENQNSFINQKITATGVSIDFETAPPGGFLNNYSSYLQFSSSWSRYNTSGSATLLATSGDFAIESTSALSWINFTLPQQYIQFNFVYDNPTPYTISAYNQAGGVLQTKNITTLYVANNITFAYPNIAGIQISGSPYAFLVDDLYFENDTVNLHTLSQPTILNPSNNSAVSGALTVSFSPSIDSLNHSVLYNATLTSALNGTMTTLITNLNFTTFSLTTSFYANGYYYLTVWAYDSYGLSNSSIVYILFNNSIHTISTPSFYNPVNNGSYSGLLNVSWSKATDTLGHPIQYNLTLIRQFVNYTVYHLVEYSPLQYFILNTTTFMNEYYGLYLTAFDGYGVETSVNVFFYIYNPTNTSTHTITKPYMMNPTNGSMIFGYVDFTYSLSSDSLGHTLYYNLTLSRAINPVETYLLLGWSTGSGTQVNTNLYTNGDYIVTIRAFDSTNFYNESQIVITIYNGNHTITTPSFTNPAYANNSYSGIINISWTQSTDSLNHTVYYTITLYWNSRANAKLVVNQTTLLNYQFDTSTVSNGYYELELYASDNYGVYSSSTTGIFIANSQQHTISTPSFSKPTNGSVYSGTVTVVFSNSVDSLGHSVRYILDIYGSSAYHLNINLTQNFYDLDTTTVPDGNYTASVFAYDNYGTTSQKVTVFFQIQNNNPTSTGNTTSISNTGTENTITATPGFEILSVVFFVLTIIPIIKRRKY